MTIGYEEWNGRCLHCGGDMPEDRHPAQRLCSVKCQVERERRMRARAAKRGRAKARERRLLVDAQGEAA